MQNDGDFLVGLSAVIWLLSLALLFAGLVLVCIRSVRRIGLIVLAASVGIWFASMGMCAVGMPKTDPLTEKHDTRATGAAAGPVAAPSPGTSVERARPPGGKWRGGDATMDGAPSVAYQLGSPDRVGWLDTDTTPSLVVRCHGHRTEVYVATEIIPSAEVGKRGHTVRLRYDGQPPRQELWSESTDDKALFAPDGVAMARRLATARTLTFEFTAFFDNPRAATFDLAGVDGVVAHVAKACGWTP
jgi:hypothetical protein